MSILLLVANSVYWLVVVVWIVWVMSGSDVFVIDMVKVVCAVILCVF